MDTVVDVFVLKLEKGRYYIGKSTDVETDLASHQNGVGNLWTKLFRPVQTIAIFKNVPAAEEHKQTIIYMKTYGIDKVRGSIYTNLELSEAEIKAIKDEYLICFYCDQIGHLKKDCPMKLCHKCKQGGHVAVNCKSGSITCHQCGQSGHMARNCPQTQKCYKCHKIGHKAYQCTVKK